MDGSLCLWDAESRGNVHAPIAILRQDPSYPVYAAEVSQDTIAVGGGSDGGFIGVPLYLYTFGDTTKATQRSPNPKRRDQDKDEDEGKKDSAESINSPEKKTKSEEAAAN